MGRAFARRRERESDGHPIAADRGASDSIPQRPGPRPLPLPRTTTSSLASIGKRLLTPEDGEAARRPQPTTTVEVPVVDFRREHNAGALQRGGSRTRSSPDSSSTPALGRSVRDRPRIQRKAGTRRAPKRCAALGECRSLPASCATHASGSFCIRPALQNPRSPLAFSCDSSLCGSGR